LFINTKKEPKNLFFVNKVFEIVNKHHFFEKITGFLAIILFRLIFVHYIKDNSIFES